jgi:hypothetical protein
MNRLVSNRATITIGALSTLTVLSAWLAVRGAESPESREVKSRLRRQAHRLESLEVTYKLETTSPLEPNQLVALPRFHNQLFLPNDEWHEAFKGPKRFQRQILPEHVKYLRPTDEFGLTPPTPVDPKAPAPVRENQKKLIAEYERVTAGIKAGQARGISYPRRDPDVRPLSERDTTRAYNGRTLWMRHPSTPKADSYLVWPPTSEPNWFQATPYAQSTGLHVTDPTGKSMAVKAQAMFQVAEWVGRPGYQLDEKTDLVDGATCLVLRGSLNSLLQPSVVAGELTDRIWLDRDHGLAVRKREFARDGRLGMRWTNSELKEVEPGLWLPMQCRQETFDDDAPQEWKEKAVLIQEIRVSRIEVNKVSDDLFDMTPRKGDRTEDLRGQFPNK